MAKKANQNKKTTNGLQLTRNIVPKSIAKTRSDVMTWKSALASIQNVDNPRAFPYYNLLNDIIIDAHLFSQIQNRKLKTLSADFVIKKEDKIDDELTSYLQKSVWFNQIIEHILDSIYYGYTLIEFERNWEKEKQEETIIPIINLVPRQNVIPTKGIVLKDDTDDRGMDYLNSSEYGTWVLDFGDKKDLGLINNAVPHVLFSRFAQSCWSELCEIYGIPPRVMKTNTRDPYALRRAEKMMTDMGAAAWFIIDESEKFEWAQNGMPSTGEVYNGLIKLCRDNISLLISGAIIGQDTKFGSKGKEESSQEVLQNLVNADQTMVEQYMNEKVLKALYNIGVLSDSELTFNYDQTEDISELWQRTIQIMPYKNIPDEWIQEKFGVQVLGDKNQNAGLQLGFFD